MGYCLKVFIAVKGHHDYENAYKEKTFNGVAYTFRGFVQYHKGQNMAACKQTWCWRSSE